MIVRAMSTMQSAFVTLIIQVALVLARLAPLGSLLLRMGQSLCALLLCGGLAATAAAAVRYFVRCSCYKVRESVCVCVSVSERESA